MTRRFTTPRKLSEILQTPLNARSNHTLHMLWSITFDCDMNKIFKCCLVIFTTCLLENKPLYKKRVLHYLLSQHHIGLPLATSWHTGQTILLRSSTEQRCYSSILLKKIKENKYCTVFVILKFACNYLQLLTPVLFLKNTQIKECLLSYLACVKWTAGA